MRYVYHAPLTLYTTLLLLSPMPEQTLRTTAAVNEVCISCSPYPLHNLARSLSHAWANVTNHSSCKWGMYIMLPLPSTQSRSFLSPMPEQPLPITAAVNKVCISCSPYPLHNLAPSLSHAWATVTNHSSCKWGMYIMLPLPFTQSCSFSLPCLSNRYQSQQL